MTLNFQNNKRSLTDKNTKANGESEQFLTPQQVMAGSLKVMTHKERQAYLKNSKLGELLGVSDLF